MIEVCQQCNIVTWFSYATAIFLLIGQTLFAQSSSLSRETALGNFGEEFFTGPDSSPPPGFNGRLLDVPPLPQTSPQFALTPVDDVIAKEGILPPALSLDDEHGMVFSPIEPPVPFGWYPPGATMGGFPPVPKFVEDSDSLHQFLEQNITVRLRGGGILRPYGFARGDLDVASHLFNDIQNPQWMMPGEKTTPTSPNPDKTNYSLYPRLTRLGVEYYGLPIKSLDDAVGHARVEIDFLTSIPQNSESRQLIRLRLAYAQVHYNDWTILAGQDWDIASPLYPAINDNTLQWNNGNPGDRRPQFKVLWDHDFGEGYRLQFQNGIALMNSVGSSPDLDGDGIRDNEYSGIPGYQGRVGFVVPSWVPNKKALGGFWGAWATQQTSNPIGASGNTIFHLWGYGTDLHLPLTKWLTFRSEFFHGANLADLRGGIGQGINVTSGESVVSTGGWFELVTQPTSWYQNSVGYSVDDPENSTVPQYGRTLNHSFYIGNRFLLGRGLVIGSDIQKWVTEWDSYSTGEGVLFKAFAQLNF
ncbi:hypothetical protein SH661x_000330 [Planctomicrobium sp. SH661]|uniref:hypothetical protein n=1 Tax=Planctomicrobium sp. SH661 TaxID=3448124 RepID=UPI003F5C5BEE